MKAFVSWQGQNTGHGPFLDSPPQTVTANSRTLHGYKSACSLSINRTALQHSERTSRPGQCLAASKVRNEALDRSFLRGRLDTGMRQHAFCSSVHARLRSGTAVTAAAIAEPPAPSTADFGTQSENPVMRVSSPEELKQQIAAHKSDGSLVIIMCKAHSCRPCKMFTRKYSRMAEGYPGNTFLEIFGDDSVETRRLMISLGIKVTPTFRIYRSGKFVHQLSGVNETNLKNAIEKCLDAFTDVGSHLDGTEVQS